MAAYDHLEAKQLEQEKEAFEKIMEELKNSNPNAWSYIQKIQKELGQSRQEKEKYQSFFKILDSFLPSKNINQKLG